MVCSNIVSFFSCVTDFYEICLVENLSKLHDKARQGIVEESNGVPTDLINLCDSDRDG